MLDSLKKLLAPPVFEDEVKTRVARMLNVILLAIVLLMGMLMMVRGINGNTLFGNSTVINFSLFLVAVILQIIMRRGYVRATSILLIILSWIALTFQAWSADGIRDAAFIAYIVVILLANLLLGWRAGSIFAGLSILAAWGFAYAENVGLIQVEADKPYSLALDLTVIFGLSAVAMALIITGLSNALKRAGSSEHSLVESNRELRALSESLELQVAARTRRLEIVAALSERLSAILNVDELLDEVVNQVKDNFNYYHTHIYLMDRAREKLVMRAGTGTAGAEMKAKGHNISMQAVTSMVVRAARTGQVVTVDNVRESPDWLPDLLLPDTYSEMAVPIVLDQEVVGVLDVQEDRIAGLDDGDASLLRSLANHVAVAIRNARLFAEVEATLDELREAQQKYVEQSWQKPKVSGGTTRHLYASPTVNIADSEQQQLIGNARKLALTQRRPVIEAENGDDSGSLVAPINLRDKTIGVLKIGAKDSEQEAWDENDMAMVEAIVDQVAQTAENLRLFDDTRGRANREQTIRQITEKMRAATSIEELIQTTANELGQRLNAGHVVLDLGFDPNEKV